jgi:trehalose synthase
MATLDDYRKIAGDEIVDQIIEEAKPLKGKYVTHVNSTYYGGGVAEILDNLVYLMNEIGINAGWRLLKGTKSFFEITKLLHNSCQGGKLEMSPELKEYYEETNRRNSVFMHLEKSDVVIAHDPQVLPLVKFYKASQLWIWRCHIDITEPNPQVWEYLSQFIWHYDEMIISDEKYKKNNLRIPQTVIMPSIDPLSAKNRELSFAEAVTILKKAGIKLGRPIISQISRFDSWKDPLGVIEAYEMAKKEVNCQLVLLGNFATDDPEGLEMYEKTVARAKKSQDVTVLVNVEKNDLTVNALQRVSEIVLQKSLREGFGLTVSEALWKGTPVIGGRVGGIPNQIIDGQNGYMVESVKGCATRIIELMRDEKKRKAMGKFGKEHVRKNFLITRHLLDYIRLLNRLIMK